MNFFMLDPIAVCNVLTFFFANGRGNDVRASLDWVIRVLDTRAYLDGTTYYNSGDAFLFFFSRLLSESPNLRLQLGQLFAARVEERTRSPGDALALAMRIIAGRVVGVHNPWDIKTLKGMQEIDGGWPATSTFPVPSRKVSIGKKRGVEPERKRKIVWRRERKRES